MNKFTFTAMVLLCYACNKTSVFEDLVSENLTESALISQLYDLNFTKNELAIESLCTVANLDITIDFDYYDCVQQSTSNQKLNAIMHEGYLYLMTSDVFIIDVMHLEYWDIDDFWVSTTCPPIQKSNLGSIRLIRFSISKAISCVDTVKIKLQVGKTCNQSSFVEGM